MTKATVYYNSACPVCDAGIASQRRRMARAGADDDVTWCDINQQADALADRGVTLDDIRLKLHVLDDDGQLHVGSDAFAALWTRTRGQRWLGWMIRLPVVSAVARATYDLFAAGLYRWNRRHNRW